MFVNTLTADDKHYLLNRDNLTPAIQLQLSPKKKNTFYEFFFRFLKSMLNFRHFPIRNDLHSLFISGITGSKYVVTSMFKKLRFTDPFDRQHGKWVETLLQSERQHLYNIY